MSRHLRIAAAVALVAGALAYAGLTIWQRVVVPGDTDWDDAAEVVRRARKPGDALVFSPAWAHAGAPRFTGLDVDIAEKSDWYEAGKHRRVWVVASSPEREPTPPEGWTVLDRVEAGFVTVHLWQPPTDRKLAWDARNALPNAKVSRGKAPSEESCTTFKDGRWSCGPAHPWQNVGPISRDIDGRVRRVIWAHARDNNEPLVIRWTDVPAGRTLTVHMGLTQRAIEQDTGAPVTVEVRVNDRVVATRTLPIHDGGWYRHDVDVTGLGGLDVALRIVAAKNQDRQFCFTADVWE